METHDETLDSQASADARCFSMTVEHVPASNVAPVRDSGLTARNAEVVTTDEGASIVCAAADVLPVSKDAAQKNVHCSGYNVWA